MAKFFLILFLKKTFSKKFKKKKKIDNSVQEFDIPVETI